MKPKYYPFYRISLNIPQYYDNSLTYYESICRLNAALNDLVNQLNEKFNETTAEKLDRYLGEYIDVNTSYTEDDKGLHLIFENNYSAKGSHVYNPETETMTILKGDDDNETFKV